MAPWVGKAMLLLVCAFLVLVLAQARSFGAGAVPPDVRYILFESFPGILVRFIVLECFFFLFLFRIFFYFPFLCSCR